ncbi:MAG: aspartate aminotransferase family protein [bacterium]
MAQIQYVPDSRCAAPVLYRDMGFHYPKAQKARGMYIYDAEGREYLDMCGGAAVSCLGHQHPAVLMVLHQQLDDIAYAHSAFFTSAAQDQLAALLVEQFGDPEALVYFSSGGSEANETALKMAWQYWRAQGKKSKTKIITRQGSYHGNTLKTLSISGHTDRRSVMGRLLGEEPRIPSCYAYRHQRKEENEEAYAYRAAGYLEEAILREGPETIAAFMAETVAGASLGAVPPVKGYFKRIRDICDKYDILLIADEVMCGTGRTGTFFAFEQEEMVPDIVTLAKGIGGGYIPLAATLIGARLAETFRQPRGGFQHGFTYVGHATACAAGVAVIETIRDDNLLQDVNEMGNYTDKQLKGALSEMPFIGDVRGRGLLRGVELISDKKRQAGGPPAAMIAKAIKQTAMKNGLLIYPNGGAVSAGLNLNILIAPPYIATPREIDEMVDKLSTTLTEVLDG